MFFFIIFSNVSSIFSFFPSIFPRKVLNNHRVTLFIPKTRRTLLKEHFFRLFVMGCQMILMLHVKILKLDMNVLDGLEQVLVLH